MQAAAPTLDDWLIDPARYQQKDWIQWAERANFVMRVLWDAGVRNFSIAPVQSLIWSYEDGVWANLRANDGNVWLMDTCPCQCCEPSRKTLREVGADVLARDGDLQHIERTEHTPVLPLLPGEKTTRVCAVCGIEQPIEAFHAPMIHKAKSLTCVSCRDARKQRAHTPIEASIEVVPPNIFPIAPRLRKPEPAAPAAAPITPLPILPLMIELVPRPCWYSNMRKVMTEYQWDTLRRKVYAEHHDRCAICGSERGPGNWLQCHEIWEYDDTNHVQTIKGFTALCEWCHHVKHIGLAGILSEEGKLDYDRVVAHFCSVNHCGREDFARYYEQAFAIWRERNQHAWTTELGVYEHLENGVPTSPSGGTLWSNDVPPDEREQANASRLRTSAEGEQHPSEPTWRLPGGIVELSVDPSLWPGYGTPCVNCQQPIIGSTVFQVHFHPSLGGKPYHKALGLEWDTCSRACAQVYAATPPRCEPFAFPPDGSPTAPAMRGQSWIYAGRAVGAYPDSTPHGGKWLVYFPVAKIDQEWARIKAAVEAGRLGGLAKVATSPREYRLGFMHVVCVYTYDAEDVADVRRVRQELRAMGYTWKIGYKTDEATYQGKYSENGQRVTLYWE
jgi:hypothetical protein